MASFLERIGNRLERLRYMEGEHLRRRPRYLAKIEGLRGIEIGGPSYMFRAGHPLDLYGAVGSLDNCSFSASTVWEGEQCAEFLYDVRKSSGTNIFCEGSDLNGVAPESYDFVLSCHNLEHFANPVKALREWQRILRPGGALILVLPNYRGTFDHRRAPTRVAHMMEDYAHCTGEEDMTHLPEILEKHDISRDPGAGTMANFRERAEQNFLNRCLHHHVFDPRNSRELLERTGFRVHSVDLVSAHIFLLATLDSYRS